MRTLRAIAVKRRVRLSAKRWKRTPSGAGLMAKVTKVRATMQNRRMPSIGQGEGEAEGEDSDP